MLGGMAAACGDGEPASVPAGTVAFFSDGDNFGDARDLFATVELPRERDDIAELRAVVVAAEDVAGFDAAAAAAAPPSSYAVVAETALEVDVRFPADATDTNGAHVVDGGTYAVAVVSIPVDDDVAPTLSPLSREVTLAVTNLVRTLTEPIDAGSGGMDVDADGNIYAADFGASLDGPPGTRVYKITPHGEVSVFAEGLVGASGNDFGSTGDLFQSNISAGKVSRIAPDGTVTDFATEGLRGPVGIAIDGEDSLHVVNCSDGTIRKITQDGTSTQFATSPLLVCPNGITLADDGNFYVANFGNGDVLRVSPAGAVSRLVTLPGNNNGHILFGNGVLYVVARSAHQLYEVTLDGEVTLLAGSGHRGQRDGAAVDAQLSLTNDVALSPDGRTLYFNDVATIASNRIISPVAVRAVILAEQE